MLSFVWVFLGSGLGGVCRLAIGLWAKALVGIAFPLGTFLANALGSFILGMLTVFITKDASWLHKVLPFQLSWHTQHLLAVGFCGGFTTFSSFALETFLLMQNRQWLLAGINVVVNLSATLLCVGFGYDICRRWIY